MVEKKQGLFIHYEKEVSEDGKFIPNEFYEKRKIVNLEPALLKIHLKFQRLINKKVIKRKLKLSELIHDIVQQGMIESLINRKIISIDDLGYLIRLLNKVTINPEKRLLDFEEELLFRSEINRCYVDFQKLVGNSEGSPSFDRFKN